MNGEIPLSIELHLIDLGILSHHDLANFDVQDDPASIFKMPVFDEDGQPPF